MLENVDKSKMPVEIKGMFFWKVMRSRMVGLDDLIIG